MKSLEENIGYTFKDKELLKKALTHTSYAYEHSQFIFTILSTIDNPTKINIGAIAAIGTQATIGARKIDRPKQIAADTAVSPVLPPASIPTLLSTYVVTLLVPRRDPTIVVDESQIRALSKFFGMFPSSSILNIPDSLPVPINVPIVSNKSDITNVNIVIITTIIPAFAVNNPWKSNCKNVGFIDGINE